ncbi:MAG: HAD-IB family phosphatase [Candidatus Thermoplasmatota archaeon]|jgi:phosphoserine phosphatase|nr:HAD-IB family phosphatase [Candidatus Thermoplasmatota archaeon]
MNSLVLAFDVDGVLLKPKSSWNTVHQFFGVNNEESLELYKKGKIDYKEFVRRDVDLWLKKAGRISISDFEVLKMRIEPNPNHLDMSKLLENFEGQKIAISGGVDRIVERAKDFYPLDEVYSNKLVFKDGYLIGGNALVEPSQKGKILRRYKGRRIAVGDSIWDKDMFASADYSILFNCSDDVDDVDSTIRGNDLRDLVKVLKDLL